MYNTAYHDKGRQLIEWSCDKPNGGLNRYAQFSCIFQANEFGEQTTRADLSVPP